MKRIYLLYENIFEKEGVWGVCVNNQKKTTHYKCEKVCQPPDCSVPEPGIEPGAFRSSV